MGKRADRGELAASTPADRIGADVTAALRRKPASEVRLAGVVRALAPISPSLRSILLDALQTLVDRGSYTRPLYAAVVRALAEAEERRACPLIRKALGSDEVGGLPTLSAACFCADPALSEPLMRIATSRHPHLAFAAELARVARGESNGDHIASLAPKIKESHRIELCTELCVPLLRHAAVPRQVAPALAVLRGAERHLGRWLVFGQIAARAGDPEPLGEASSRAEAGPASARAAWSMVAWALSDGARPPPDVRPTVELVARLSDRPSSDRDTTFLFRLADARAAAARTMLETFAKGTTLGNESAIRAALYLARDHGRDDLMEALQDVAQNPRKEALRGLAAAALHDAGAGEQAKALVPELAQSRQLPTLAWGALLEAAESAKIQSVVNEAAFRRVQHGWAE
jgi:hypothetical protein